MNQTDYEIRVEGGIQFLYYKGEKLPNQTKSVIIQGMEAVNSGSHLAEVTITVLAILKDTK